MSAVQTYETDFYAWTQAQAQALRTTRPNHIDWANIAEELETMGRSERRELESRLRVILIHLLKWRYQAWRRSRSWETTLRVQRRDAEKVLRESPSLRPMVAEAVREEYPSGALLAYEDTGLAPGTFPVECPFSADQVLNPDYLPEAEAGTADHISPGGS